MGGVDAFVVVIATIFSIKVVIKVVLFCFVCFVSLFFLQRLLPRYRKLVVRVSTTIN